jgi:hypothetical protein
VAHVDHGELARVGAGLDERGGDVGVAVGVVDAAAAAGGERPMWVPRPPVTSWLDVSALSCHHFGSDRK